MLSSALWLAVAFVAGWVCSWGSLTWGIREMIRRGHLTKGRPPDYAWRDRVPPPRVPMPELAMPPPVVQSPERPDHCFGCGAADKLALCPDCREFLTDVKARLDAGAARGVMSDP